MYESYWYMLSYSLQNEMKAEVNKARHLPLRAKNLLWSQFALASSHWILPHRAPCPLPFVTFQYFPDHDCGSQLTLLSLLLSSHFSVPRCGVFSLQAASLNPSSDPHHLTPACLCRLHPFPPPWLCLLASFELPLMHDHQPFKACATCPFSSHQSGMLSATFCEVHLSVWEDCLGLSGNLGPVWQPLWLWRSTQGCHHPTAPSSHNLSPSVYMPLPSTTVIRFPDESSTH